MIYRRIMSNSQYITLSIVALCIGVLGCTDRFNSLVPYSHDEPAVSAIESSFSSGNATAEYQHFPRNTSNGPITYRYIVDNTSATTNIAGNTAEEETGDTGNRYLYFIFTNTSRYDTSTPKVSIESGGSASAEISPTNTSRHTLNYNRVSSDAHTSAPSGLATPIHIDDEDRQGWLTKYRNYSNNAARSSTEGLRGQTNAQSTRSTHAITANAVGETDTFFLPLEGTYNTFTARLVRQIGDWRLIVWTDSNVFSGCTGEPCLDLLLNDDDITMVGDSFLQQGEGNDIFDWVTNLVGYPWGDHHPESTGSIPSTVRTINILLTDIDNNRYSTGPTVVGYFSSANNYLKSEIPISNEGLMFYADAPFVKFNVTEENETEKMRLQDWYRYTLISTLAHEFQHMIFYYQRAIAQNIRTDPTWINEQYSLIIEDLINQKIFNGNMNGLDDRGLNALDAGTYPICSGRLPAFLRRTYYGISRWDGGLINYAVNYAFGAFLLRNYGGVSYLKNAYSSTSSGVDAIESAIDRTMGEEVARWGVAVLLSDTVDAPTGYRLNSGAEGFSSIDSANNLTYTYGSINYYNYGDTEFNDEDCVIENTDGILHFFNNSAEIYYGLQNQQHGHSNIYYLATDNFNQNMEFKITVPPNGMFTAVSKTSTVDHNPTFYE